MRDSENDTVTPPDRTRRWAKFCFGAVVGRCLLALLSWALPGAPRVVDAFCDAPGPLVQAGETQ